MSFFFQQIQNHFHRRASADLEGDNVGSEGFTPPSDGLIGSIALGILLILTIILAVIVLNWFPTT